MAAGVPGRMVILCGGGLLPTAVPRCYAFREYAVVGAS